MAESKAVSGADANKKDAKDIQVRRQDYAVCFLGLALVLLTKFIA